MLEIRDLRSDEASVCEAILRALPGWFGIESALMQYVADTQRFPTRLARLAGRPAGFMTIHRHFPESAEIHCLAVRPEHHRTGLGRALVADAEDRLRAEGVRILQVKTLGPSRESPHYEQTRRFYRALAFVPLEEFPALWPGNPCLLMVKPLG